MDNEQHEKLRDKFAAAALAGIYASRKGDMSGHSPSTAAKMAYEAAEAMMIERDKRRTG